MKKIINTVIALVILLAVGSTSVFAAFTETVMTNNNDAEIYQNLTEEQKRHFLYNHLSIETEETSKTHSQTNTFSYAPLFYSGNLGLVSTLILASSAVGGATSDGYSETNKSIDWVPYCGPEKISKLSFLHMVGAYDLEDDMRNKIEMYNSQYDAYKRQKNSVNIAGYTLLGVGLGAMLAGALMCGLSGYNNSLLIPGGIIAGVGSLLTLSSLIPLLLVKVQVPTMEESKISMSLAIGLANDYNHKLLSSYNSN